MKILLSLLLITSIMSIQEKELLNKVIDYKMSLFPSMQSLIDNFFPNIPDRENYKYGRGFTNFSQKQEIIKYEGVEKANIKPFLSFLVESLQVPSDKRNQIVNHLALTQYAKKQELITNDIIFSVGNANCRYLHIIGVRNRDDNTTDWVVANINLEFSLAPNILILHSSKSGLFGLWKSESTRIELIPNSLTTQQVEIIIQYFQIVAYTGIKNIISVSLR